jgi:hypothetical protein
MSEQLRHRPTAAQVRTVLTRPEPATADVEERIRLQHLQILAQTITDLDAVLAANYQQLEKLVRQLCPALLGATRRRSAKCRCRADRLLASHPAARRSGRSPLSPAPHRYPPAQDATNATVSIATATEPSTPPSTRSSPPDVA